MLVVEETMKSPHSWLDEEHVHCLEDGIEGYGSSCELNEALGVGAGCEMILVEGVYEKQVVSNLKSCPQDWKECWIFGLAT
jgi:hypothetical protein